MDFRTLALSWTALFAAMILDIFMSLTLPVKYPGYSRMKDSISALGNPESPVRRIFNFWMFIEGIFFLISMAAFYDYYHKISLGLTVTAIVFIIIFAVGACIFTCFFSVNKSKDVVTTASKIHGIGSVTGFTLFLFVPLLVSRLSFLNNENGIGIIGIICFILSLITYVLFVMADKPKFSKTFIANEGLWQRLNLFFMYCPLIIVSVKRCLELRP